MTKVIAYLTIIVLVVGVLGYGGFSIYQKFFGIPANSYSGQYSFEVKSGDTIRTVAKQLEEDKVAYESALLVAANQNPVENLQPGTYVLELNKTPAEEVLAQIKTEAERLTEEIAKNKKPSVKVTVREGLTIDNLADLLEKNGVLAAAEFREYVKNPTNFNKTSYPFLPEPLTCTYGTLKDCAKYYVEGYLYPDTYDFFTPSTPKEVTDKMLTNFNQRVWNKLQSQIGDKNFHQVVIMASVIEKETGRTRAGVSDANRDEVNGERKLVAGVFYNRLEINQKWESDPTIGYPSGKPVCQSTLKREDQPGCLLLDSPEADNPYNSYRNVGYPIGPITSPQDDNIIAALTPTDSNYLFFVADGTGKKYFAENFSGHQQNITKVQEINRGLGI